MPTFFLEMMMQRRHQKEPARRARLPAREFVKASLQQYAGRFHHKNTPRNDQDQRLMNQYRDDPQRATQSQRTGIPHEDLRRVTVKPQKSQPSSDHRRTKNSQLP